MKGIISSKYLTFVFRVFLGAIFCYAAVSKIVDIDGFARAIYYYHILPGWAVNIMAVFTPMIEIFAGLGLILGIMPRGSAALLSGLLVVFIVALVIVYLRGVDINCGCFSVSSRGKSSALGLILRDIPLLIMGLQIFFFGRDFLSIQKLRR